MEVATRRREQEVWQACDDLWAKYGEFKKLTGEAIREELFNNGKSRGSPNEIYKYRKTWISSRNIKVNENLSNREETDPISRAVRMVHEKLQGETEEKLLKLKESYEDILKNKDVEIKQLKIDIQEVVSEYDDLQKQLQANKEELKQSKHQLEAEIDIRNATQQKLTDSQAQFEGRLAEKSNALEIIQNNHKEECIRLKNSFETSLKEFKDQIDSLNEDKKRLGIEFSDALNNLKTKLYNLNIQNENLNKQINETEANDKKAQSEKEALSVKYKSLNESYRQLKESLFNKEKKNKKLKEEIANLRKNYKSLMLNHKKVEIKLARMRARWSER